MGSGNEQATPSAIVGDALSRHASRLRAFVAARVSRDDIDDVLQAAALRAVERSASLREPGRALSWLYQIHRNAIVDLWRQKASQERLQESEEAPVTPPAVLDDSCDCSLVQARRLRPTYASVLALIDAGDGTLSEVAESLGISVNNAAVRLHRARKALREAMRKHCGVVNARDCDRCRCAYEGCCVA